MDIVEAEGIKIPNSVIVTGLTNTEHDNELIDTLKRYGSFARTLTISDKMSEFYQSTIFEYNSGQALQSLEPQLPYTHQLSSDPGIIYHVKALSSVFTQQLGSSVTKSYLEGLKEIAKLSGTNFEAVLNQMLSQMSAELTPVSTNLEPEDETQVNSHPKCFLARAVTLNLLSQVRQMNFCHSTRLSNQMLHLSILLSRCSIHLKSRNLSLNML